MKLLRVLRCKSVYSAGSPATLLGLGKARNADGRHVDCGSLRPRWNELRDHFDLLLQPTFLQTARRLALDFVHVPGDAADSAPELRLGRHRVSHYAIGSLRAL